ncbi:MAG TPA: hypothetical protein VNB49_05760, partial [Candidatus Dormibacteraeota bacterium]|nr:hypothetical protein [Candidatus Dormibacteraeota bacterium]
MPSRRAETPDTLHPTPEASSGPDPAKDAAKSHAQPPIETRSVTVAQPASVAGGVKSVAKAL